MVTILTIFQTLFDEIEAVDRAEGFKVLSKLKTGTKPKIEDKPKNKAKISVNTEAEYDWQRQDMTKNPEERVLQMKKEMSFTSHFPPSLNEMGFSNSMLAKIRHPGAGWRVICCPFTFPLLFWLQRH